jgi:hypothetical protein
MGEEEARASSSMMCEVALDLVEVSGLREEEAIRGLARRPTRPWRRDTRVD